MPHHFLRELRVTLKLGAPIMAGQFAQMLIGLADTLMVGRVGVTPLAACAFANTVVYMPFLFALGILTSTAVRTSHAVGAGQNEDAAQTLRHGVILALVLGVLCFAVIAAFIPFTTHMGQPPEVVAEARNYLLIVAASLLPALLVIAFKNHCEALNLPWPAFWITMGGVLLNIGLNWVLIFGEIGAPSLGLDGAGWATLAARIAVGGALLALILCNRKFAAHRPNRWLERLEFLRFKELLKIGIPSGSQLLMEVGAFSFSAFMMGWVGASALAAHQITLTCAATTFMFPLGLSMALTIRIGQCLGSGEIHRLRIVASGAVIFGSVCMAAFGVVFLVFRHQIAGAFVEPGAPEVIKLTAQLLIIAALFQMFDGAQVISMGGLRGLVDVNWPTAITLACYWGVSLPVGWVLGFVFGLGAVGIWTGLLVGLGAAALSLGWRLWLKTHHAPDEKLLSVSPSY